MNPSASGWIKKYYTEREKFSLFSSDHPAELTKVLREIGFTYGHIDLKLLPDAYNHFNYSQEELAKIVVFQLFENIFSSYNPQSSTDELVTTLLAFYNQLLPVKKELLPSFFQNRSPYDKLEKVFNLRIKNFFFTYSTSETFVLNLVMLSIDVLSFEHYIQESTDSKEFNHVIIQRFLKVIELTKKNQQHPSEKDKALIDYLKKYTQEYIAIAPHTPSYLESCFLTDFILINSWDNNNKELLITIPAEDLSYLIPQGEAIMVSSKEAFLHFLMQRNNNFQFFTSSNLWLNLFTNSTNYLELLLSRNKDRLIKELKNNKVLIQLLVTSSTRELTKDEKKIVKKQTLETLKTIPSLAIFLLPGGTLLLPIVLKFIPSLLPSIMNENKPS